MPAGSRHRSSATPLALAYAALIVYASLFPFTGWRWPPGQSLTALAALPWHPWTGPFDLASNLLGYLPLGALITLAARRSGLRVSVALTLALLAPTLLSYGSEVLQQFLPGRHTSLKDLAMNSAGAALGALLALAWHGVGLVDSWHRLRTRWFARDSAGALALLALWPVGLLFPAPVPLGLGKIGELLRGWLASWLDGAPWAAPLRELLAVPSQSSAAMPALAEAAITALGLLAPCLVAYSVVAPGRRRLLLSAGAAVLAVAGMTLSTWLNFGPQHALAWLAPQTVPALLVGLLVAALLAPLQRRVVAGLGLVALTALVVGIAQAPDNPYFALSLRAWEQGRFARFHGLAQWIGWLWPYAAMGWFLSRLSERH